MKLTFYLVFLIGSVLTSITFDQGQETSINYVAGPTTITNTITFSNTFQQIPQIIIEPYYMSLERYTLQVQFTITSVTLTNFKYKITNPSSYQIIKFYFNWIAINQDRIQVLNPSKETIVTNGKIYTCSHTFSQVTQACVILNSIGYQQGGLDFSVSVYSISSTNVQIKLFTVNTKIELVGYQIILGTKEAFYATAIDKTGSGDATLGEYAVKKLQNSILYCPFFGFSWNGASNVRIARQSTTIASDYQYSFFTFNYLIYIQVSGTIMNSVTFQSIQFFTQILFPYYAKKYIVSKQLIEFPTDLLLVKFIELNQSFNSDTSQTFNLLSTQTQLNVQIQITLTKGKKIEGFMLKCNECGSNNKHFTKQTYYSQGNLVKYRIQLLQYTNSESTLVFSIQSNKILIQQVINQVVEKYDILQLEILND